MPKPRQTEPSLRALLREAKRLRAQEDTPERQLALTAVRSRIEKLSDDQRLQVLATLYSFVLTCTTCDRDAPDSLSDAEREGWKNIDFNDGPTWWFLGKCPACACEGDEPSVPPSVRQGELF